MSVRIIGDHPLAKNAQGNLVSRIGTLFLRRKDLVTLRGIHATQRIEYTAFLNEERKALLLPPLTTEEEVEEWSNSVDLIMETDSILIRPDPQNMAFAFEADEILQELVSKQRVLFVIAIDDSVRQAVRRRGEYWRIAALPKSPDEMKEMIRRSRIEIQEGPIYHYNMITGTRLVTLGAFRQLADLEDAALARQLQEIRDHALRKNRRTYPEVDFFMTKGAFGAADLSPHAFLELVPDELRRVYAALLARFQDAVPAEFRAGELDNAEWRNRMFAALIRRKSESVAEEVLQGLSPEFFLQIQWLPAGRIEDGELMFDTVFEELEKRPDDPELCALCDLNGKAFFFNFIREFGNVEFVNIGRIVTSLTMRSSAQGRRDVYIAEIKLEGVDRPVVRIIRMQKWGIRERLGENKDMLRAIMESEEYTEYILDRRLGCRQMGMNLSFRVTTGRIGERYHGWRREFEGLMIWATYFERDYVNGIATDKIPPARFEDHDFSMRFAALLGRSAAPNIIVGRLHLDGRVLFDDGDEVLLMDEHDTPKDIIVADHTGTFVDFKQPLAAFAEGYAHPFNVRAAYLPHPRAFVDTYLDAFTRRFEGIQRDYRKKKRGFETLFKHQKRDDEGCFAYRWERVLERLDKSDAHATADAIRSCILLPARRATDVPLLSGE